MKRVLLVPLDERPCCLQFAQRLAGIAGIELVTPPLSWLGQFLEAGQPHALKDWYAQQVVDEAIVSLDMLAFGGLVASRRPDTDLETAREVLAAWLEVAHSPPLAFQSILRTAPTQTTLAEVNQAQFILELSGLSARQALGEPGLEPAIAELKARLPLQTLALYLGTRQRNHQLNADAVEWLREGRLAGLLLGIDDSKTMGWNVLEVRQLCQDAPPHLWVAPGTDESAQLLLARLCNPGRSIQLIWSHAELPARVCKYEDRSLGQLVAAQMAAASLRESQDSEWQLFIYGRLGPQGEAEDQQPEPLSGAFMEALAASLAQGRRVMVADVAHANGGDVGLGRALAPRLAELLGYSAWNTAGNSLGTALAWLGCAGAAPTLEQRALERRFAQERWLDDLVYQSLLRPRLRTSLGGAGLTLTGEQQNHAQIDLAEQLSQLSSQLGLPLERPVAAHLPWGRLFEVAVEVSL